MVDARGAQGIPVRCDHLEPAQVRQLGLCIAREQQVRLDIVVNDIWGGDALCEFGKRFWQPSPNTGLRIKP